MRHFKNDHHIIVFLSMSKIIYQPLKIFFISKCNAKIAKTKIYNLMGVTYIIYTYLSRYIYVKYASSQFGWYMFLPLNLDFFCFFLTSPSGRRRFAPLKRPSGSIKQKKKSRFRGKTYINILGCCIFRIYISWYMCIYYIYIYIYILGFSNFSSV